jgi:glycosyltransferase involved in cell wall biosynthesis
MHIGLLSHFCPADLLPGAPGVGRSNMPVLHLARALLDQGCRVSVFCAERDVLEPRIWTAGDLTIHAVPHRPKLLVALADGFRCERSGLLAAIRENPPDILHAHWPQAPHAMAALESGLPAVVTVHDAALAAVGRALSLRPASMLASALLLRQVWRVLRRSRQVIAVAPYVQEHLRRVWNFQGEISVIPNAVPAGLLPPPAEAANGRAVLRLGDISGWYRLKRPKLLLRAFRLVRQQFPAAQLWLCGGGMEAGGPAARWAQARGLAEGVAFRGWLEHSQAMQELARLALFCHPSSEEACSCAIQEAMAAAVPVLAFDVGGNRTTLHDDRAGLLLEPSEDPVELARAICALLADPATLADQGCAARAAAQKYYQPAVIARQHLELYTAILRRNERDGLSHIT